MGRDNELSANSDDPLAEKVCDLLVSSCSGKYCDRCHLKRRCFRLLDGVATLSARRGFKSREFDRTVNRLIKLGIVSARARITIKGKI